MTRSKIDLVLTNVINVFLFVGIFVFGYVRWQKLQDVIVESNASQDQYRIIHGAMRSTMQLDHLGENVYEWMPSDSALYQRQLKYTIGMVDSLRAYYSGGRIDTMQARLNEKGHILNRIYETVVKRNENDEHLRQDKQITVRDTETYTKHYTGNIARKSREVTTSRSKHRTVVVPSINEIAFIDKTLYDISLSQLSDSLAEVNKWLDVNMSQMLDADDTAAEKNQSEIAIKASNIGKNTFRGGMALLLFAALLNVGNSWRRARTMKKLEEESEKNKRMVDERRKMMYAIVHDLRTPLSIIIGYNDMEKQCPTKNDKYIGAVESAARQLRGMIDQLLDYFKLESNKGVLKSRDFSLIELANELTTAFELKASENRIEFVRPDVQNVVLNGDYEKVCHIVENPTHIDPAHRFQQTHFAIF